MVAAASSQVSKSHNPITTKHSNTSSMDESGGFIDSDDIDEHDEKGQSIILNIISQLRPGSDLTRVTLPTFILEKKSMLERVTNQLQFPNLLLEAHKETDQLTRFVKTLKWYLAGWHIAPKAVKKPLNPVLGELFTCYWDLPNKQQAFYIAEQTSHHPPESSYFYMIPESHIRLDGVVIPKSKFLGNSSAAMMEGLTVLSYLDIKDSNGKPEKYTFSEPNIYVRGILFGKMKIEMGDHMIVTSSKYSADIEFKTKGFVSGTYDAILGKVKDNKGAELFEISGKWNDVMYIKDLRAKNAKKNVFYSTHTDKPLKPKVHPLKEQDEYESRKLWKEVVQALANSDQETATEEKFKIEEYQRNLAKKRLEDGVEFQPRIFVKSKPGKDLDFYIYKYIPNDAPPEEQIKSILEVIPILPGQKYTDKFNIPAFEKHEQQHHLLRHQK
ncbi:hypothetical protein TBLA_0B06470 [Henningerozyma blattae CBS 6284]|uniref:Oxysterol-binding protein n=1 Tax=Henningerozyma blattae (strain ATCC 34711 / CBS 6284 / DSM 70876 / NBRC 10599 / NRRL Y-10934 / UCD 77-7) TaxID=1071380 RepID=I2GZB8_HENB6|nr:hypothetical protein TBLA_0B06470 [Tetrapisispora blattae CBS 6284]CCH59470.1 hypothetical protein TBLA_0B06470 [Tetrapisispora blattae CBS 6284]